MTYGELFEIAVKDLKLNKTDIDDYRPYGVNSIKLWLKSGSEVIYDYNTIKQALLKQLSGSQYTNIFIDEAVKPSEALKCLEYICKILNEKRIDIKWLFKNDYNTIKQYILKSQEQEKVLNELLMLINDLDPTFNRKGVSSDTDILGTIIKDYFIDNASDLLRRYLENEHR